jgi:hypothetical protein
LLPESEGSGIVVRRLLYAEGVDLQDSPIADPMAAVISGKKGPYPLPLREDRAFWRDFHALTADAGNQPPALVVNALDVLDEGGVSAGELEFSVGGLLPDQAKVVLWRLEHRPIAPAILHPGCAAVQVANRGLEISEAVGRGLSGALRELARAWLVAGGDGKPSQTPAVADSLQVIPGYWQRLEAHYWALIERLAGGDDPTVALDAWKRDVEMSARVAWETAVRNLGGRSRAVAAAARSGGGYARALIPCRVEQQEHQ